MDSFCEAAEVFVGIPKIPQICYSLCFTSLLKNISYRHAWICSMCEFYNQKDSYAHFSANLGIAQQVLLHANGLQICGSCHVNH